MDKGLAGFYCFAIVVLLTMGQLRGLGWEECLSSGLAGAGLAAVLMNVFPKLRQ